MKVSESDLQRSVIQFAHLNGWLSSHFHDSRRQVKRAGNVVWIGDAAAAGFPDLTLARTPRVVFAELKAEQGRLTEKQKRWLAVLHDCPGVEVYVWRPSDWAEIVQVLGR